MDGACQGPAHGLLRRERAQKGDLPLSPDDPRPAHRLPDEKAMNLQRWSLAAIFLLAACVGTALGQGDYFKDVIPAAPTVTSPHGTTTYYAVVECPGGTSCATKKAPGNVTGGPFTLAPGFSNSPTAYNSGAQQINPGDTLYPQLVLTPVTSAGINTIAATDSAKFFSTQIA